MLMESHAVNSAHPRVGRSHRRGVALVFALLGMVVLSLLAASMMYVTNNEVTSAANFRLQAQASYASHSGVQRAVDWYNGVYAPWLDSSTGITATAAYTLTGLTPTLSGGGTVILGTGATFTDSTVSSSFNGISTGSASAGSVTAAYVLNSAVLQLHERHKKPDNLTDVLTERWLITVTGAVTSVTPNRTVRETATIERFFLPLFRDAIRGRCTVDIGGAIVTDSYYSSRGAYGSGGNLFTGPDAQSSVGSNALITATGAAGVINGNAYWGTSSGSCVGGEGITHDTIVQGQITNAPGVPFPPIEPAFTDSTNMSTNTCSGNPETYLLPNTPTTDYNRCSPTGSRDVVICVPAGATTPATFFFNELSLTGTQSLFVRKQVSGACTVASPICDATCPAVILYVNNALDYHGGAAVLGAADPTKLSIMYSGTAEAVITGNADFYGTIYAPNAQVRLSGNGAIYGALTALDVRAISGATVHYDLSLQNMSGYATRFRIVNQTRQVF